MKSLATALLLSSASARIGDEGFKNDWHPKFEQPTFEAKEIAEMFSGLYSAFGGHFHIMALLECIKNEDKALLIETVGIQEIIHGIKECKAGDCKVSSGAGDIFGGAWFAYSAIGAAKQAWPMCEDIWTDAKQNKEFMDTLASIKKGDIHFDHKHPIMLKVLDAANKIEAKDFEGFGKVIGEMMKAATAHSKGLRAVDHREDIKKSTQLISGFYNGLGAMLPWTQLLECIYEADQAALEAVAAVNIFEQGWREKSIVTEFASLVFMFLTVQAVRTQVIPVCTPHTSINWTAYDDVMAAVKHPFKLNGDDFTFNGKTITTDIKAALEKCYSGDTYACGEGIGSTLAHAVETKDMFLF